MPDFVYVLVRRWDADVSHIVEVFSSVEKACEVCEFMNKEENTVDYEVEQHRMIK